MPRYKPWLKMWVEWIHDPKMDRLTQAEVGAWWGLVTLAHVVDDGGALSLGRAPLTLEEIMGTLKVRPGEDQAAFRSMVDKMTKWGSLDYRDGALFVVHYQERQDLAASDTKEAMRQRQRDRRARLKSETESHGISVTGDDTTPPHPVPPSLPEEEDKEERRGESCRDNLVTSPGPFQLQNDRVSRGKRDEFSPDVTGAVVTSRDSLVTAEVAKLYEEFIGVLNPADVERIKEFAGRFRGEISWLRKGFVAAGVKRRWPYIQRILERYEEEGGPDGQSGRDTAGRRSPADRRDDPAHEPAQADRFGGFHAIDSGPDTPDD